jgi:hypothetical protein
MGALKNIWGSERGIVAVVLILACTVLTGSGDISPEQWLDYTKWIFVTYAAAKTVTGAATIMRTQSPSPASEISTADFLSRVFSSLVPQPPAPPPTSTASSETPPMERPPS